MGDVLFTFDVDATSDLVRRVLTTTEGIASFWTDQADIPAEVGETLGTVMGLRRTFRHGTLADETEEGRVAYVWGQVMVQLQRYLETGVAAPVIVKS